MVQTAIAGPSPWNQIAKALRSKGPRVGAVAYLGADAPRLLSGFGKGDRIVVNASLESVRAGATSPYAIETLMARGVEVRTSPRLHAKVFATSSEAVIGSANASANSQNSQEAVVITSQASLVRGAIELAEEMIDPATPVTTELVKYLKTQFGSRRVLIPGVTGTSAETRLLPQGDFRVHLLPTEDDDLTEDEHSAIVTAVAPDPQFAIEPMQLADGDSGYIPESVLLRVSADSKWLLEPAVVYSSWSSIPGRAKGGYQLLRTQKGLRRRRLSKLYEVLPSELAEVLQKSAEAGESRSMNSGFADPILKLWKLDT